MKARERVEIDGLVFDPITQDEALERVANHIKGSRGKSWLVVKPYVEFFGGARKDPAVTEVLRSADLVLADSVAVQWAASWQVEARPTFKRWVWSLAVGLRRPQWLSRVIPERGEGATATHRWLLAATEHGWRVGVVGGPRDVQATESSLRDRYALLQLEGVWSGYFADEEERRLAREIAAAKLDVLFVAMGFPRQELFMGRHRNAGLAKVLIGEGGTFDYDEMGGHLRRAPRWMRSAGLEWIWRLLLQPRRLGRMLSIPRFIWRMYLVRVMAKP